MAIPGIKVTQSAIESYKASRSLCDVSQKSNDLAEAAKQSVAMVRKPITRHENHDVKINDALSYAVSHGTPEKEANKLDTIV